MSRLAAATTCVWVDALLLLESGSGPARLLTLAEAVMVLGPPLV